MSDIALLVLRLCTGIMFAAHGSQKVFGLFGGPGIQGFSKYLEGMGFAPAIFWAIVAAYVEFLGGISLVIGFGTKIFAALLLINIIVATVKVHLAKGFFLSAGGFEYNLIIASVLIALLLMGTGKFGITKGGVSL